MEKTTRAMDALLKLGKPVVGQTAAAILPQVEPETKAQPTVGESLDWLIGELFSEIESLKNRVQILESKNQNFGVENGD